MLSALLIDEDHPHAERLEQELTRRGLTLIYAATVQDALKKLKHRAHSVDFVIFVIGHAPRPWLHILHELQQAAWQEGISEKPLFLCISRFQLGAEHQFKIEQTGARYAFEE